MVLESTQLRLAGPIGPSITQIVSKLGPIFAGISIGARGGGVALARARQTAGPSAVPIASGAVRTVSQLGKTRAGLNLRNRDIILIGGTAAAGTISTIALTQPGPSGQSAIETFTKGATEIAEDLSPGLENVTKFVQENGLIIALAIGGIVLIGLIK